MGFGKYYFVLLRFTNLSSLQYFFREIFHGSIHISLHTLSFIMKVHRIMDKLQRVRQSKAVGGTPVLNTLLCHYI